MKNIWQTFKYLFKNILPLALFSLPAALFFAYKYNTSYFLDYLTDFDKIADKGFADIYVHFSFWPSYNLLLIAAWLGVTLLSFSLIFSYTERHMKYGIKSFFKSFKSLNYTLFAVLPAAVSILIIAEVFSLLLAVLVNLLRLSQSAAVPFILPIIYVLMYFLAVSVISIFAMWIPIKIVTGYKNRDALRYSVRLFQGRQLKLFIGILFPLLVASPIMVVVKNFVQPGAITLFYLALYIIMISYYAVFLMVSYFDYTGTYRKDIKVKLFPKK